MEWTSRAWQFLNQRPLPSSGGIRLAHSRTYCEDPNEPIFYSPPSDSLLSRIRDSNLTSLAWFKPVLLGLGALISLSLVLSLAGAGGASAGVTRGEGPGGRTLVSYVYHETEDARANAEFFLRHGLHSGADFVFILNGETDLAERIPKRPNVKVVQRDNTCFDIGAHGEVLTANKRALVKKYDKFILMNSSVRGPFVPFWSQACWTSSITSHLTPLTKLVGLSWNCVQGFSSLPWLGLDAASSEGLHPPAKLGHLQAMLLATDRQGLDLLLTPLGLDNCYDDYDSAVRAEIRLTHAVLKAGYQVKAFEAAFNSAEDFADKCTEDDPELTYYGLEGVNPFEMMFVKTKRGVNRATLDRYTEWVDGAGYDAEGTCGAQR